VSLLLALSTALPLPVLTQRASAELESPAANDEDCAKRVAARVQSYYESVVDFRASFQQVTRSVTLGNASLGADAPSRGVVQFAKPGKMRWHYQSPAESLVISDNEILWLYDPVAREAQRLSVTKDYLAGAALEFLLGDAQILEEFDVSVASCSPDAKGVVLLKLMPRQPASYEVLRLGARVATGEITQTHLVDLFGNETSITFSDVATNLKPDDDTFRFDIPDGVRVIDLVVAP
jgi:outer membrane lipoprotein carrier protein